MSTERPALRERLVSAATAFTVEHGWASLTMAKLAEKVGVSRQTVYNELGAKPQLAEAMVLTELSVFLGEVDTAFSDNPDDLIAAIRAAAKRALVLAEKSPLLHAVLTSSQGADTDLLPLLTIHAEPVLGIAGEMVREHVVRYDVPLPEHRLDNLIDMVVRLVLSHVMQPGGSAEETAETIGWIAERVVARD